MKLPRRPRLPWNRGKSVEMTFEEQMLRTATLALIAFGAVMVYSASSGTSLLSDGGDSSEYLKRYLASAALGLVALSFFARHGPRGGQAADADPPDGRVRRPAARDGAGGRHRGERLAALARRRAAAVPALGGREARAGPVRGDADLRAAASGCAPWPGCGR